MQIYCPVCEYHPSASDRWQCRPGCFTVWNTFETRALCPGCSKQWRHTWCPSCSVSSLHDDWYHDEAPDHADSHTEDVGELVGVP
jgi:hypothetical protein